MGYKNRMRVSRTLALSAMGISTVGVELVARLNMPSKKGDATERVL